ncbi:hypothetical protein BJX61DRAFT_125217 [Aspergillus egyptiacus]|nr:hypothetical protein BJX61DRAFT_125217 [Aspergillus egyptiacus]
MEKRPPAQDYKTTTAGPRVDNPPSDGLHLDRTYDYDTGFKYHIPEAEAQDLNNTTPGTEYQYQNRQPVGDERPTTVARGGNMGERLGSGVRGVFAGIHGAGELLRGGLNATVDRAFGSEEGVTKNEAIARAGQEEMRSGRFSQDTRPGAWDKRQ